MELRIGDLVQCRDNHYNRGLRIVNRIGMVAELRRKDVRILFDVDNRSTWVSKAGVNRITLPPTVHPTLTDRITWLIRLVEAEEFELELDEIGNYRCTVVCGEASSEQINCVCSYMGLLLSGLKLIPCGMSRLGLVVTFPRMPEAR